jgi:putative transposase
MRQPRVQAAETIYHITSRGNNQQDIFLSDSDRLCFLQLLEETIRDCQWHCYAYCLMSNHYHMIIEVDRLNLSEGMHSLNLRYAQTFNFRNKRNGHLFQSRYDSRIIDNDTYFLLAGCYIVLNPVEAGMVAHPADFCWSSYRQTAEGVKMTNFLEPERFLATLSDNLEKARTIYREFVQDWMEMAGTSTGIPARADSTLPSRPTLEEIFSRPEIARNQSIVQSYFDHNYKLREIAAFLRLSISAVGKIVKAQKVEKEVESTCPYS